MKKVLAGVMHTIENEFESCIQSVQSQKQVHVTYFVIHDLPNRQAHDKLYDTFMKENAYHDFFVKVDADMVLKNDLFFYTIGEIFNDHPELMMVSFPVYDHFSEKLINGIHSFRNTFKWDRDPNENIYTDASPISDRKKMHLKLKQNAGVHHCPNPSPFQAFHYGMHKAIKVDAGYNMRNAQATRYRMGLKHYSTLMRIFFLSLKSGHLQQIYVLEGVYAVIKNKLTKENVSYNDLEAISYFKNSVENVFSISKRKRRSIYVFFALLRDYPRYSLRYVSMAKRIKKLFS